MNSVGVNDNSKHAGLATAGQPNMELTNWPAYVDGIYVLKTFRFRPASTEYREVPTRRQSINIIFKIEDNQIPADYFVVGCWADELERFKQVLAADDGYITVVAMWVNQRVPRDEFKGAASHWVDGRRLIGKLQMKWQEGK